MLPVIEALTSSIWPGPQRDDCDDQFRRIAEGGIEQPADASDPPGSQAARWPSPMRPASGRTARQAPMKTTTGPAWTWTRIQLSGTASSSSSPNGNGLRRRRWPRGNSGSGSPLWGAADVAPGFGWPGLPRRPLLLLLRLPWGGRRRLLLCSVCLPLATVRESFWAPLPPRASRPQRLRHRPLPLPADDLEQRAAAAAGSPRRPIWSSARRAPERSGRSLSGVGVRPAPEGCDQPLSKLPGIVSGRFQCLPDRRIRR